MLVFSKIKYKKKPIKFVHAFFFPFSFLMILKRFLYTFDVDLHYYLKTASKICLLYMNRAIYVCYKTYRIVCMYMCVHVYESFGLCCLGGLT